MSTLLTAGDVSRITGLSQNTLNKWCRKNLMFFSRDGEGKGCFRYFTVIDILALTYALEFIEMGFSSELAFNIVKYFEGMTEEQLIAEFRKGNTYLLPLPGSKLQKPPRGQETGVLDLSAKLSEIEDAIARRIAEEKKTKRGRKRGTEAAAKGPRKLNVAAYLRARGITDERLRELARGEVYNLEPCQF